MTGRQIAQRNPVQELMTTVRDDDFKQQISVALPPEISPDKFIRITATAVMQNPDLADTDRASLLKSLIQCAQMGLVPDGRQAALVPYKGKVQLVAMVGGMRDIAAEYGWTLYARVVHEHDEFEYTEEPPTITHRPPRPGEDRGDLIAAYAVAVHRDGRRVQRVLHPGEIEKRRKMAQTDLVWSKWTAQMWEKTAARDLFGELPLADSDRVQKVLAADLTPEQATTSLYGLPPDTPQLPAADATAGSPSDRAEVAAEPPAAAPGTTGGDGQQDEEAQPVPQPAASSSPGTDEFADEPVAAAFQAPATAGLTPEAIAANDAAEVVIAGGVHKGKRLGEVDDGWIKWAAEKHPNETFRAQVVAYARVYAPDAVPQAAPQQETLA